MTDQSFEVDNVKMTFRTNSDINSGELTTIYTGDAFYMFLKYNGGKSRSSLMRNQNFLNYIQAVCSLLCEEKGDQKKDTNGFPEKKTYLQQDN